MARPLALVILLTLPAFSDVTNVRPAENVILTCLQSGRAKILSINARTGVKHWESTVANFGYVSFLDSSLHLDRRGRLYYAAAGEGKVYSIQARTGEKLWEVDFTAQRYQSFLESDGERLFVSEYMGGRTAALDLAGGRLSWEATGGGSIKLAGPNLVLYSFQQARVSSLKLSDGSEAWGQQVQGLFLGTSGRRCIISNFGAQETQCLDAATGKVAWKVNRASVSAATSGGTAYLVDKSGLVSAIEESTGRTIWEFDGSREQRTLFLGPGVIFALSTQTPEAICLDASSGQQLYRFDATPYNVSLSSQFQLLRNRAVYVNQRERKIVCIEAKTGRQLWEHAMGQHVVGTVATEESIIGISMRAIVGLDARTGEKRWEEKSIRSQQVWGRIIR
jgi:outer membrane protein assembly factor BamB